MNRYSLLALLPVAALAACGRPTEQPVPVMQFSASLPDPWPTSIPNVITAVSKDGRNVWTCTAVANGKKMDRLWEESDSQSGSKRYRSVFRDGKTKFVLLDQTASTRAFGEVLKINEQTIIDLTESAVEIPAATVTVRTTRHCRELEIIEQHPLIAAGYSSVKITHTISPQALTEAKSAITDITLLVDRGMEIFRPYTAPIHSP